MNTAALLLLLVGSMMPKPRDTVESVRQQWVKTFSQDPARMVEIFHGPAGCLARPLCPDEEVYTLGIVQAAADTGHPVLWTTGSSEDDPKDVLEKASAPGRLVSTCDVQMRIRDGRDVEGLAIPGQRAEFILPCITKAELAGIIKEVAKGDSERTDQALDALKRAEEIKLILTPETAVQ